MALVWKSARYVLSVEDAGRVFVVRAPGRSRAFANQSDALSFAKRVERILNGDRNKTTTAAWSEASQPLPKPNPITTDVVVGVGLFALGAYALYRLSSVVHTQSSSTTTGPAVSVTPDDANKVTSVTVGGTVTFSLPQTAGESWQSVMSGTAILSATPATQTSSSGVSETYTVVAPGSATVAYQLLDASGNPSGAPLDFQLTTGAVTPIV